MLVRKQFKFEAAHTLVTAYSGACVNSIHGHSYLVEVVLKGEPTTADGMVVDFGYVKALIGGFVNAWDHAMIISAADPIKEDLLKIMNKYNMRYIITAFNPTAEEMALYFSAVIGKLIEGINGCGLDSVKVHETATGWAQSLPTSLPMDDILSTRFNHFDLQKLFDTSSNAPKYVLQRKEGVRDGN
jgi:6-pyruvoyltetrahydropterin/6-carboxytetrahydropterin synthase